VEPHATSRFAVSDAGWQFGALAYSSPATVNVPNREGAFVQISGRAATVHDKESPEELSPVTRWRIGGAGTGGADSDVSGSPYFGLSTAGRGVVEIGAIGFEDLANTTSIRAGTLTLHYVDEVAAETPEITVLQDVAGDGSAMAVSGGSFEAGNLAVVGPEVVRVVAVQPDGVLTVERGTFGSGASTLTAGSRVFQLCSRTVIMPFVQGFFGTPASGGYSYPIQLPNVRVVAAEMFMTNSVGNSETGTFGFTANPEHGLRTLSGGQLTLQVSGFLAIQTSAVPPLRVGATHSVRDILAMLGRPSSAGPVLVRITKNGEQYCDLTIAAGQRFSNIVSGTTVSPLRENDELGLDIISISQSGDSTPGSDLTVTVRL
jgi:hypothetical protein